MPDVGYQHTVSVVGEVVVLHVAGYNDVCTESHGIRYERCSGTAAYRHTPDDKLRRAGGIAQAFDIEPVFELSEELHGGNRVYVAHDSETFFRRALRGSSGERLFNPRMWAIS